jgi:hypothetical protein
LLAAADAVAAGGRLFHVLGSHASDVVAPAIEGMHYRPDRPYLAVGRIDRLDRA